MINIIYQIKKLFSTNYKHPTTAKKKKKTATRQRRGEREQQALAATMLPYCNAIMSPFPKLQCYHTPNDLNHV